MSWLSTQIFTNQEHYNKLLIYIKLITFEWPWTQIFFIYYNYSFFQKMKLESAEQLNQLHFTNCNEPGNKLWWDIPCITDGSNRYSGFQDIQEKTWYNLLQNYLKTMSINGIKFINISLQSSIILFTPPCSFIPYCHYYIQLKY